MKTFITSFSLFFFFLALPSVQAQEAEEEALAEVAAVSEISSEVEGALLEAKTAAPEQKIKRLAHKSWKKKKDPRNHSFGGDYMFYKAIKAMIGLMLLAFGAFSIRVGWEAGGRPFKKK